MAALNDLIQKIENPELRAQIQAAADRLTKQKKFGLVFEEHLPECTPLYDIPVGAFPNGGALLWRILPMPVLITVSWKKNGSHQSKATISTFI